MTSEHALWKPLTKEHVQLLHLDFAANMVAQLVPYTEAAEYPSVVQNACLESFFVNARLLAEFVQGWGSQSRDFWAASMVSPWKPADGDVAKRLRVWWELASKHVVHFGLPRLTDHEQDALPVDLESLGQIRDDVLAVYGQFRNAYRESLPEGHADKRLGRAPYVD